MYVGLTGSSSSNRVIVNATEMAPLLEKKLLVGPALGETAGHALPPPVPDPRIPAPGRWMSR